MPKGDDIQERLTNFAVQIIQLCSKLPKTTTGKHIANQLLRSGTSPAPNYAEARGAESISDFIHKLGVTLKELKESDIWLTIIYRTKMVSEPIVTSVANECTELSKIISRSIKTSKLGKNKITN